VRVNNVSLQQPLTTPAHAASRVLRAFQWALRLQRTAQEMTPKKEEIHRLMECELCHRVRNRDENACDNLFRIAFEMVRTGDPGARPLYLKRPEHRTESEKDGMGDLINAAIEREAERRGLTREQVLARSPRLKKLFDAAALGPAAQQDGAVAGGGAAAGPRRQTGGRAAAPRRAPAAQVQR
jgi:hypothetical protein